MLIVRTLAKTDIACILFDLYLWQNYATFVVSETSFLSIIP